MVIIEKKVFIVVQVRVIDSIVIVMENMQHISQNDAFQQEVVAQVASTFAKNLYTI